nr:connectin-like [Onthophagus taurus]
MFSNKFQIFFYILIFWGLFLSVTGGSRKEKDRKKDRYKTYISTNPCKSESQDAPINCFCNPDTNPGNATNIECWVFGTNLTPDYSIWNHFASQPRIQKMQTRVRPNGIFNFIPTKAIVHLKNLKSFEVVFGSIDEIHPFAFANLTSLQILQLAKNQIVNLSHHAFAHLPNLTELYLEDNRIAELKRGVFVGLPSLQKFDIANNNLSIIQDHAFRELSHLIELDMNANYINVLTKEIFTGLSELKKLDLSNNSITMLGDLTFAELWVLEDLLLESNQIAYISDRAFAGLTMLKYLNLADNHLNTLSPSLLEGLLALSQLDLRGNNLESLTSENVHPFVHNLYNLTSNLYLERCGFRFVLI